MKDQTLADVYAEKMQHHPYGHALYTPHSTNVLKPGAVGYFDREGDWNPIVQLDDLQPSTYTEAKGLATKFLPLTKDITRAEDENTNWLPKVSAGVKKIDLDASISANIPAGMPVELGTVMKYKSSDDFGAVLVTSPPVIREMVNYSDPFERWVAANEKKILSVMPEVKQYGMWVITKTYSTTACSINAWSSKETQVSIGFTAKVAAAADLSPHAEWVESSTDSGWNRKEAKEGERLVVFVAGLHFGYGFFGGIRRLPKSSGPKSHGEGQSHGRPPSPKHDTAAEEPKPKVKPLRTFREEESWGPAAQLTQVTLEHIGNPVEDTRDEDDFVLPPPQTEGETMVAEESNSK